MRAIALLLCLLAALAALAATLPEQSHAQNTTAQRDLADATSLDSAIERHLYRWDFIEAFTAATRQLELRLRWLEPTHPDVAATHYTLGSITRRSGNKSRALDQLSYTLRLQHSIHGPTHPALARTLIDLARVEKDLARKREARMLLDEALRIARVTVGKDNPLTASVYQAIGVIDRPRIPADDVIAYYELALDIRIRALGEANPSVIETLCWLAHMLQLFDRHEEALAATERAVKLSRQCDVDSLGVMGALLSVLSTELCAAGRCEEGREVRRQSLLAVDGLRVRSPLWLGVRRNVGASGFALATMLLDIGAQDEAWEMCERGNGWIARSLALVASGVAQAGLSATHVSLRRDVLDAERALDRLAGERRDDHEAVAAARLRYFHAETALMRFERDMVVTAQRSSSPPSLADVQRALAPDEAIIGWLEQSNGGLHRANYSVWSYVVRRDGVNWENIVAGNDRATQHAWRRSNYKVYEAIRSAATWPQRVPDDPELAGLAQTAWRALVAPMEKHLDGADRLFVITSVLQATAPLECLRDDRGRYLADRFTISYISSATELVNARAREAAARSNMSSALVIGAPTYNDATANEATDPWENLDRPSGDILNATQIRSVLDGDTDAVSSLPNLPMARAESERIAALFDEPALITGADATVARVRALGSGDGMRPFKIVHVATHALSHPLDAQLSALVLAPGDSLAEGVLVTAREIQLGWQLDADVVTMSGCQTGRGPASKTDGLIGFPHALFSAGARSLLASEWEVDDVATALLMVRFYENATGSFEEARGDAAPGVAMHKALALREAKAWLRAIEDDRGRRPFAHPTYWAGFVLLGSPD